MSVVRYHKPEPRLATLMRQPGGLPVAEALDRADANLGELKADFLVEIDARLTRIEAEAAASEADAAARERLYAEASSLVGAPSVAGLAGLDAALQSLCELVDGLRVGGEWKSEPVAVHIQALRLLRVVDQAEAAAVLDGLRKVAARFDARKA